MEREREKVTYDIVFTDDNRKKKKGFWIDRYEAISYVKMYLNTNESYFSDFKGGTVSVVCNESGLTVYSKIIPNE